MKSGVFLVDILVNAAGALMMVFLVFVSRQYTAQAAVPPSAPYAAVLKITVNVYENEHDDAGDALRDTLLTLCTIQSGTSDNDLCMGPGPLHTGKEKLDLFRIPNAGEKDPARHFTGQMRLGRPSIDTTGLDDGKLEILIPCPLAVSGWRIALDYGTVWETTPPTPRDVSIIPELLGSRESEAKVVLENSCNVIMSAETDAVCEWALTGNAQCGEMESGN